eukprot:13297_1
MATSSVITLILVILQTIALSATSIPDCRAVFEDDIQYKPIRIIDVCLASTLNNTFSSMMYKCDDVFENVVQVLYNGTDCNHQNVISSESIGVLQSSPLVNCASTNICHHAITKSFAVNNCSQKTDAWIEKVYPTDWCYSYEVGYSTEQSCDSQQIIRTTLRNYEDTDVVDTISNCKVGVHFSTDIVVHHGQCSYERTITEITKCYASQSSQIFTVISMICLLVSVLTI